MKQPVIADTPFQQALHHSALLGPLVCFAQTPASTLEALWNQSVPGKLCNALSKGVRVDNDSYMPAALRLIFHPVGFLCLCVLLLVVMTVTETTAIGLGTWGLTIYGLLTAWANGKRWLPQLTLIDGLVWLFFLSAAVSAAFSSYPKEALLGLAKMLTFLAGYLSFRHLSGYNTRFWVTLLWALGLLGVAQSCIGFYQLVNNIQPLATWQDPTMNEELQLVRVFGTLQPANPNLLAGFLIPCWAASVGLVFYYLVQGAKTHWVGWACHLLGAAVTLCAIGLTGSRGAYLAIAMMGTFLFFYSGHLLFYHPQLRDHGILKKLWLGVALLVVVAIVGAVLGSDKLMHRVASIFAMREDSSIAYRLNVYASCWQMFMHNWWLGIGPGNEVFKLVYGMYQIPGYNALASYSVPLEILVEQGVIGLVLFLLLLTTLKLRVFVASDRPVKLPTLCLMGLLFMGIAGSFVYGFFDTIWYRPAVNIPFWVMVALLAQLTETALHQPVGKQG